VCACMSEYRWSVKLSAGTKYEDTAAYTSSSSKVLHDCVHTLLFKN